MSVPDLCIYALGAAIGERAEQCPRADPVFAVLRRSALGGARCPRWHGAHAFCVALALEATPRRRLGSPTGLACGWCAWLPTRWRYPDEMGVQVEVFSSPGCSTCGKAKALLDCVAAQFGAQVVMREVNVVEELDYAVRLGVLSTPAIAIDGELVSTGVPSASRLKACLEARLSGAAPDAGGESR